MTIRYWNDVKRFHSFVTDWLPPFQATSLSFKRSYRSGTASKWPILSTPTVQSLNKQRNGQKEIWRQLRFWLDSNEPRVFRYKNRFIHINNKQKSARHWINAVLMFWNLLTGKKKMKNFSSYFFITVHFIRILHFSTTNPLHSCKPLQIYRIPSIPMGLDSSVGIATRYGMDGLGIESRCQKYHNVHLHCVINVNNLWDLSFTFYKAYIHMWQSALRWLLKLYYSGK